MEEKKKELEHRKEVARQGGGEERIARQHDKGKLTARERIHYLMDEDSFKEIGMLVEHRCTEFGMDQFQFPGDGVVTGYGNIDGRLTYIFAQDFTVLGGSLSETHAEKICKIMDLALQNRAPIIGLNDSGGARIQEGVNSLGGYADIFFRNTISSGVIPQISAVMGPCAGGAVYSPALTDFIFMVEKTSYMFVTGPGVVKTVTRENVTAEELGGARAHATKSGVTQFVARDDKHCLDLIKSLLSYLPQSCDDKPHRLRYRESSELRPKLEELMPDSSRKAYDMKKILIEIVDTKSFFEVQEDFAQNLIVGFARVGGQSIGVVANQPRRLAGVLDVKASRKGARFVRFCDCFNIPILVLVDVPGFLPGTDQEWNAIIANGSKLLYAFCESTVPRVTLITRKAYGGAYDVMNSKHIGSDINYAWPTAEVAVMGAKGASEVIFRKEISESDNPEETARLREQDYAAKFANPYRAAARGFIDEVILPEESRSKIISAFSMLRNKRVDRPHKKHGNIPL